MLVLLGEEQAHRGVRQVRQLSSKTAACGVFAVGLHEGDPHLISLISSSKGLIIQCL
jgi:hypothetical protein